MARREVRVSGGVGERVRLPLDPGGVEAGAGQRFEASLQSAIQRLQLRLTAPCATIPACKPHSPDV